MTHIRKIYFLLQRENKKALRRIEAVKNDQLRVSQAPQELNDAELLKTVMYRVKKYDEQIEVMDYAQNPPVSRVIKLSPGQELSVQIKNKFRQAKRLSMAKENVEKRMKQVVAQQNLINNALKQIEAFLETGENADNVKDFELLMRNPSVQSIMRKLGEEKQPVEKKMTLNEKVPYREYQSSSGVVIWVGKNARCNDLLTFKCASPHAVWMHACAWQGAHVVVQKKRDKQVDPHTLNDAALLAAHFSKAPADESIEVIVTEVKFVKKIKKSPPGTVIVSREKRLWVRKDVALVKALLHKAVTMD